MSEKMLQRASSKRNKTSQLYSLNDQPDQDIENPTDDDSSGDINGEEKVIKQSYCNKAWQSFVRILKTISFGRFQTKFYYKKA